MNENFKFLVIIEKCLCSNEIFDFANVDNAQNLKVLKYLNIIKTILSTY